MAALTAQEVRRLAQQFITALEADVAAPSNSSSRYERASRLQCGVNAGGDANSTPQPLASYEVVAACCYGIETARCSEHQQRWVSHLRQSLPLTCPRLAEAGVKLQAAFTSLALALPPLAILAVPSPALRNAQQTSNRFALYWEVVLACQSSELLLPYSGQSTTG